MNSGFLVALRSACGAELTSGLRYPGGGLVPETPASAKCRLAGSISDSRTRGGLVTVFFWKAQLPLDRRPGWKFERLMPIVAETWIGMDLAVDFGTRKLASF
jgi:hypothetical protein